jgi:gliding-associated putative ABC transporter substrate-binding component GldG
MARIWALYKKEVGAYFNSPVAYIVLVVLLIGVGYLFFQPFFAAQQASLRIFFRLASFSFLLLAPAITMRQIAEEKKTGTIELLLTLPVREYETVLAKFFAAWTLLAIYLAITFVYPLAISLIGNLDRGPAIGGYAGLFLLGGSFVALGLFASCISRNQVISLIVAVAIAGLLFVLDLVLPFLPPHLQNIGEFLGVDSHFQNIGRGVLDSRDLIYSLSLTGLFLFLAVQALQTRLADHSRQWRLNRLLYIGAAVGCAIAVNAASYNANARLDLTADKQFTLSVSTRDMLRELTDHLTVTAYFSKEIPPPANNNARMVRDLLEEFRAASNGRMSFAFVDPDAPAKDGKPDEALIAQAQSAGVPKIELQAFSKDQAQSVKVFMGVALQYADKTEALPVVKDLSELEYELASRLSKLLREKTPTLAFAIGQGELSTGQGMTRLAPVLSNKFTVKEVDLSKPEENLSGVDVLLVCGPKKPLSELELYRIDQFIMRGGKAALFVDRADIELRSMIGRPLATGLEKLAAAYGVQVDDSLVLDALNERIAMTRNANGMNFQTLVPFPALVHVADLAKDTPMTRNLAGFALPFAAPLELTPRDGVVEQIIARSSPKSWLFEVSDSFLADPQTMPTPGADEKLVPHNLVATLTGKLPSYFQNNPVPDDAARADPPLPFAPPDTRVVIAGSSWWMSDIMQNRLNAVLFANLVDWLAQDERLTLIRSRTIDNHPLRPIGDWQRGFFKYGNMLLPPLALVAFGAARWWRRGRTKRRLAAEFRQPAGREG